MLPALTFLINNWKAALIVILMAGSFYAGMRFKGFEYLSAEADFRKAQDILVTELTRLRGEQKTEVKTEVRTVYVTPDDGCLDRAIPDGLRSVLSGAKD